MRRNREEADDRSPEVASEESMLHRRENRLVRGTRLECLRRVLFCDAPMFNAYPGALLLGLIPIDCAHRRDKTWTWRRSHPVSAVLET